ncbi:ABC transporter ATP-binding protein [Microbacterium sp.]|uniref:ABC transporter ATP-binding protein n=1 Tax=Microbacterium sp. TaxID=51671 RepID=UPI002735A785|nr:ABC transporter ATP-binding protein [Microbacterium sp.]MDP3950699.1 ABC transporter ATP-binding protein [Microbacterium sp.]
MTTANEVVLAARDVEKRFRDEVALRGVSLRLRAGRIHALVGLNGAGKTTFMRTMLGMIRPDAGDVSIRVGGEDVAVERISPVGWRAVGHLVEAPFSYPELTVSETIIAAARLHSLPRTAAAAAAQEMIDRLALGHWADRRTHTLSLGNRQRLGLACALAHDPQLLILDEPANGLDPAGVLLIRTLLREAAAAGAAILISSHHLDEMARIADTITVMHAGRIVGMLPPNGADIERQFFDMVYAADEAEAIR